LATQDVPSNDETRPPVHGAHAVIDPTAADAVPGAHMVHASAVPEALEKVPAGHGSHSVPPGG
jgi:hypothetical protein